MPHSDMKWKVIWTSLTSGKEEVISYFRYESDADHFVEVQGMPEQYRVEPV